MPSLPRRILVCRIDNLGDIVMALPSLRWLKSRHPGLQVEIVVRDYARALAARCPWIDRVWTPPEVAAAAAAHEAPPDAVFHLQSSRELLRDCRRWGIPLRVGNLLRSAHWPHCNRWVALSRRRARGHDSLLTWRYFEPVFGPAPADWPQLLRQTGWLRAPAPAGHTPGGPLHVVVHPGSNGNGRQWPLQHHLALVRALREQGHAVSITGGPAEREALAPLLSQLPAGVDDRVGTMSLDALVDHIAQADTLVASGTGPLHLAGAMGVRAVGIFPPRPPIDAARWRPIGPEVCTLEKPMAAPCREACTNTQCACMAAVTPAQVLAAVLAPPTGGGAHTPGS